MYFLVTYKEGGFDQVSGDMQAIQRGLRLVRELISYFLETRESNNLHLKFMNRRLQIST
jgi:hypothetical protein